MHFFEFVTVLAVVLGAPALLFHFILRLRETRHSGRAGKEGDGTLRLSELDALIQEAVDEAVEPLARRIAELEARSPAGLLDGAPPLLDLEDLDAAEEPAALRHRART